MNCKILLNNIDHLRKNIEIIKPEADWERTMISLIWNPIFIEIINKEYMKEVILYLDIIYNDDQSK